MNFLTDQERSQLKLQHKQERDKRVFDRIKAVLLYDQGWSYEQIAEVLLLTGAAISNPALVVALENLSHFCYFQSRQSPIFEFTWV